MYENWIRDSDRLINDLLAQRNSFAPLNQGELVGLLSTRAATTFELCIKRIYINFAEKKHRRFGDFVSAHQRDLKGRIKTSDLRKKCREFGEKYKLRFDAGINEIADSHLQQRKGNPIAAYDNLIDWRNRYVHAARLPEATFEEAVQSYNSGKLIIDCLFQAMKR